VNGGRIGGSDRPVRGLPDPHRTAFCGGAMARPILTPEERFMQFVSPEPNSGCWLWLGGTARGYGQFYVSINGKPRSCVLAHRFAWQSAFGKIPAGMDCCHKCDVKTCVNVEHLFISTRAGNMADMASKNRGTKSKRGLPRGVYPARNSRLFAARFRRGGISVSLGCFETQEEASLRVEAAYAEVAEPKEGEGGR